VVAGSADAAPVATAAAGGGGTAESSGSQGVGNDSPMDVDDTEPGTGAATAGKPLPADSLGKDGLRELRAKCVKEIRRPGKRYDGVLDMVRSVKNELERRGLIADLCKECTRYRMADLISLLEREREV